MYTYYINSDQDNKNWEAVKISQISNVAINCFVKHYSSLVTTRQNLIRRTIKWYKKNLWSFFLYFYTTCIVDRYHAVYKFYNSKNRESIELVSWYPVKKQRDKTRTEIYLGKAFIFVRPRIDLWSSRSCRTRRCYTKAKNVASLCSTVTSDYKKTTRGNDFTNRGNNRDNVSFVRLDPSNDSRTSCLHYTNWKPRLMTIHIGSVPKYTVSIRNSVPKTVALTAASLVTSLNRVWFCYDVI